MNRSEPFVKIRDAAAEIAASVAASAVLYRHSTALGDSEIEKIFYVALSAFVEFIEPHEYNSLAQVGGCSQPDQNNINELLIEPQAQIGKFRVDFLIWSYDFALSKITESGEFEHDPKLWRKLVVECDGHDFHERTKEQAAKDRSRDRTLTLDGYTVFRFTGSELWRDPIQCAATVAAWWKK